MLLTSSEGLSCYLGLPRVQSRGLKRIGGGKEGSQGMDILS